MAINVNVDGICGYMDFCIEANEQLLAAGIYERSRVKVRSMGCKFGFYSFKVSYRRLRTKNDLGWNISYERIPLVHGRDSVYYAYAVSNEVGGNGNFIISTEAMISNDLYDFLMKKFKLPLLREWMPTILAELLKAGTTTQHRFCVKGGRKTLPLHGKEVPVADIVVWDFSNLDESRLSSIVSGLLSQKAIWITKKEVAPLSFKDFDDYIKKYGASLVANLEKEIVPLSPLKGEVDGLALKHKRLYPQQGACVNGIKALKENGIKYGIMNEGMGTGKTIQGASVVDSYFVEQFLSRHKDKSLKDALASGAISYRVIIMAPGHLVEKWQAEIQKEIPHAKAIILNDFSQLIDIRDRGKARNGKEFYILSKDFCKLGSQYSPIPSMIKEKYVSASICADCFEEDGSVRYRKGTAKGNVCPACGGNRFRPYPLKYQGAYSGLVCPECGELLLNLTKADGALVKDSFDVDEGCTPSFILTPKDFSSYNNGNDHCYHCGASLWGNHAKPLDCGGEYSAFVKRSPKWRKISFFNNLHHKTKKTAFVLRGHEDDFIRSRGLTDYDFVKQEYGPRKTAPSAFIKKYLKGYFDFCILDEVHKFEGAGTAQANAAHALIRASDFTLGLTGTIANGTAGSFYYLLFMLDPKRLRDKGYEWSNSSYMQFCKTYGSVETVYEYNNREVRYNASSRGRQITQPKVKPGISPVLFVDFLLDRCVFLDITDLSKFLPPLYEKVITCLPPEDIMGSYNRTVADLKEAIHTDEGRCAMTQILQFGLSYPDKPYGRNPIMSAYTKDYVLSKVDNYTEYEEGKLLPKEEKLVEIINREISEGRNCFVYASYTGEPESNITGRLKSIIERFCNLSGRVQIIEAASPAPLKRESWIQRKASEGTKVFITNPKCVETGLDFCFNYEGREYNYPTLIFMQMSYEMSVIWQASRRHYRLNQRKECRTFYLAYEGTLQTAALEIMAAKQVATSAIQGKFSSEGLAAMAKGVDTRTQLAEALAKNDMSSRASLENMFDALNQQNNVSDDAYGDYVPPKTYYEIMGMEETSTENVEDAEYSIFDFQTSFMDVEDAKRTEVARTTESQTEASTEMVSDVEANPFFDDFFASFKTEEAGLTQVYNSSIVETHIKAKKNKVKAPDGQFSLIDLFGIA